MSRTRTVAVVGASGGLGTSTLAVAVARRVAGGGSPSVAVDLDPASGGLDVTAGVEHLTGRRWPAFAGVRGAVPEGPLLASLPHEDGCHVLAFGGPDPTPLPAAAVTDVVGSLAAGAADLVLDVPRGSPHLGVAVAHAGLVVVVVGLRTRQLADADACVQRVVDIVEDVPGQVDLRLVTRGFHPAAAVLDDVQAHLGLAHLVHVPDDPAVVRDAERGFWPGSGHDAVRRGADAVVSVLTAADAVGRAS